MRSVRGVIPAARAAELRDGEPAPADTLRYLLYLPDAYDSEVDAEWPLVLALHGAGERGADLDLLETQGLPRLVSHEGRELPFVLVAPQCSSQSQWVAEVTTLSGLLDEVTSEFRIDPARVSVTGFSMGGFGTWSLAVRYPDRFAAIAPICGGLWNQGAEPLRDLPVWTFHGEDDTTVPISFTEDIVAELEGLSAPVRFTRCPGIEHDSWTRAYDDPALLEWLVSQERRR